LTTLGSADADCDDRALMCSCRWHLGDVFARNAGYNEVGELNNIIIIYPQATPTNATNPYGCWDWWGYTVSYYGTYGCMLRVF